MLSRLKNHITLWQSFYTPWNYWFLIKGYQKAANLRLRSSPDAAPCFITFRDVQNKDTSLSIYMLECFSYLRRKYKIQYFHNTNKIVALKNGAKIEIPWDWKTLYGIVLSLDANISLIEHGAHIKAEVEENISFIVRPGLFLQRDVKIIKEIWKDRIYNKYIQDIPEKSLIIDIGGYIGETAVFFSMYCKAVVHVYEPHPALYDMLTKNLRMNKRNTNKILSYNKGVGRKSGNSALKGKPLADFGLHDNSKGKDVPIQIDDLSTIFNRCAEQIDLVKMDCEGAEYDSILHTPTKVLQQAKRYLIEYHGGNPRQLAAHLEEAGMRVKVEVPFITVNNKDIGILYAAKR